MTALFDARLHRLRARMEETGTDLVAVGPTSHMRWLAGLSPHGDERPVMILVGPKGEGMLMPALNAASQRSLTTLPFFTWSDDEGPTKALTALLAAVGATGRGLKVSVDETMRADFAFLVVDALEAPVRSFAADTVGALRAQKDDAEYRALKANALINDAAMRHAFSLLREGVSEAEIGTAIEQFYVSHGARKEFISVCFGENGAFPHHDVSDRRLRRGDPVLIDIGGRSAGYPSDMTRVGSFGPPSAEFSALHAIVEGAVVAGVAAAVAGARGCDVDGAARGVIRAAGYGDRFLHRTGHGLGIDIHEPPNMTATSETVIAEGHCFSIEPGIYLSGQFGLRLEEIVIIRNGRAEVLSEMPRDIIVVG
jgi:Xaa-Pro aminopeptidase